MKSVLITGINGFVGKHLIEIFEKEYFVIGLDICEQSRSKKIKKYYQIDITNKSQLFQITDDIDFIVHLSALTNPNIEKEKLYKVNVEGVKNICEFAKIKNIKKIIYLSSVSVYSEVCGKIITEETKTKPINYYGETKLAAEEVIKNSGLIYTILRPTNIFGEGREDYKKYFERIKVRGKRLGIIFYRNRNTHLLYVKDVRDVIEFCLENEQTNNEIYIVADAEEKFNEKEIFKILLEYYGLKKILLPYPLFWGKVDKRIFSAKKLNKIFTFRYGIAQGIFNTLRYFDKKI